MLLFYKIILAILERLEGQRVEGVVSKKTSEETNLDKLLVSLTRVVGVVRLGTYFEVMIDWQNLLINWMVGMRESRMTPTFFGVNEWCTLMKWRRLEEKKQESYLRDVETTGYKALESKGEVTWGVTADSWC